MTDWMPMNADAEQFGTLVDGIPPWLRISVQQWITAHLVRRDVFGDVTQDYSLVNAFDIASRRRHPVSAAFASRGVTGLIGELGEDGTLEFLDYLVHRNNPQNVEANVLLDRSFAIGGSVWKVGTRNGRAGLERRVSEGVQEAAEAAMGIPGHTGTLLSEAWHATFGRDPDYEKGYSKAIKAVEAAAIPVVSPSNSSATLGTVIAQIRSQGDWGLGLSREHPDHSTKDVVLGMLQGLWTGQNDRHAGQPGYTPSSKLDGEAAVMLAVPLVQFFASGALIRR